MNSEAITKQSSTLHGLVNGNMLEAHSRTVVWPDVDEDTFARFCEFYYLDNYSPPSCGWDGNTVEEALPVGDDSQSEKLAHALESPLVSPVSTPPPPPQNEDKKKEKGLQSKAWSLVRI